MPPHAPKSAAGSLSWRERLASLHNVRPLLAMVWETSPALVGASVLLRLFRALIPVAMLWVSKLILDAVVGRISHKTGTLGDIWRLVALELALAVASDVLGRANTLGDSLLGDRFTNRVSVRLMEHATQLDLASFEDPVFYDKLERARRQTTGRLGLLASLLSVCQDGLSLLSLSAGLLLFSPWLMALLVAAVIPAFLGETHFTTLAYSVLYRWTPQRRQLDYLRLLGASAQSAKEVKIFGLGRHLSQRYHQLSEDIYLENKALAIRRAAVGSALNLVSTGGYYGAYAVVLIQTLAGAISLGTFTFLTGAFSRSRTYIERILSSFTDISEQAVFLKDLFEFFAMEPSIRTRANAIPAPRPISEGLEFRNVGFAYPGSERMVVKNINFRLYPCEKLALIGENGAGKTTLVKLLARLYDPTEGQILLDGVDLRDYDVESLRREIGVIFQDYMRYDMFVRENIGFGRIESLEDRSRIERAAARSMAKNVVERLPNGYDQMVGRRFEGGMDLSGGEWQKFALARAYMRDAQLLILDEPTATLDARAEYEVFRRFADLTRGRMAVLISHRFSTVRMADRILVLAGGAIQEQGTHKELLALGGRYAELFELQAAGYR
ncbi:MAG: ABC transporter ATP-binding protein/permease [Acidobacteriia bacterium]|nr:ABC transporter ATP-binding protein/permease [Terriglobia bacterium]